jgi:hypothetical protein
MQPEKAGMFFSQLCKSCSRTSEGGRWLCKESVVLLILLITQFVEQLIKGRFRVVKIESFGIVVVVIVV